jgi:hypothetical protein
MLLALIVCVIGLIMYMVPTTPPSNGKFQNLGLHMFWVGLFVTLMQSEPYVSKLVLH